MALLHFVARARYPLAPLRDRELCANLWHRLRRRFPRVVACVLMPDHVHLIADGASTAAFATELTAFARSQAVRIWEPFPDPSVIPNSKHLRRQIRYVHLNPCRDRLVRDPLEWEFSTHREAVGAAPSGWVDISLLRSLWGGELPAAIHHYVSSDPSVSVTGTPLPARRPIKQLTASLEDFKWAALQATRAPTADLGRRSPARRLILLAAARMPLIRLPRVGKELGVAPSTLYWNLSKPATTAERATLAAMELLLSTPERFRPQGLEGYSNSTRGRAATPALIGDFL